MKIAYLDTIAGIAGDMTMAAFVSAGLPIDELSAELRKLPLTGFELIGKHVMRNSISAVHIEVAISHTPHYHRHLKDIYVLIDTSTLSQRVKDVSKSIFHAIGEAEAKVHNTTLEKIHFHEVGALDSIVDIVGAAICLEKFAIDAVYTSPVRLGCGGLISTQHGVMPTPAPATIEILRSYPTILTDIPEELTTPTGAGIVKALSSGMMKNETFNVHTIGYGAGTKEFSQVPNLLRVMIGEVESEMEQDEILLLETNIDDMNPQIYPYIIEKLLASGAHDAYLIPIIMKKGRPGILLSVMVDKKNVDFITQIVYSNTTTLGIRIQHIDRKKLPRRQIEIESSFGRIKVKSVLRDGREVIAPEFEECKRIAEERHLPLPQVIRQLDQELSKK